MLQVRDNDVNALIERRVPHHSLEQAFYTDPDVFALDMERVVFSQWLFVDHDSRIPNAGDWFLFRVGGEEIIVARARDGAVHAFYNVCRHRGSRVCLKDAGNDKLLVCPYHAWSYDLDGSLKAARLMPEGFDRSQWGLHPVDVRVWHGLIYVHLGEGEPEDFDEHMAPLEPYVAAHGLERARVAHRGNYPTQGNWKLVLENFFECYHCQPSHPNYCTVHSPAYILAYGGGPGSGPADAVAEFDAIYADFEKRAQALGHMAGSFMDPPGDRHIRSADRMPLSNDFLSETSDGRPAAPLMGDYEERDGGYTAACPNPFSTLLMSQDFAVSFRFTPRDVLNTDVEIMWLVDRDAPDAEVDTERMTWLWHVTTLEDKKIIEDNQKGVLSRAYQPGPYSEHEKATERLMLWYLHWLGQPAA